MQVIVDDLAAIERDIATIRKRLIDYSAVCDNFSDSKLVQISEELDKKIMEYMKNQLK